MFADTTSLILLVASVLLFAGVLASKLSSRFGIPLLLGFILVGMLAGTDGIGRIYFDDAELTQFIGVIALSFVLFSGGMETRMKDIKPVWKEGVVLATLGVAITAAAVGIFIHYIYPPFSVTHGLLLGAVVSSTDAAATFSLFRTRSSTLKNNLRPILELESGSNDPMAYFLTISCLSVVMNPDLSFWSLIPNFFRDMAIGVAVGYGMAKAMVFVVRRINIDVDGLYSVLMIAMMMFTYAICQELGGNGFMAVYLAGIVVGNSRFSRRQGVIKFYSSVTWLMQIVMFLLLGLLCYPTRIAPIAGVGLLVAAFLIFVARPVAVFVSTVFFRNLTVKDKLMLSWGGLRGASPILFATYPIVVGAPNADIIFNIVFFISCMSVLLQGTSLMWMAEKLELMIPATTVIRGMAIELSESQNPIATEVGIRPGSFCVGQTLSSLDVPVNLLVMLIERDGESFIPNGNTAIMSGDKLYIISDQMEKTDSFVDYLTSN